MGIAPLDLDVLREQFRASKPFPFVMIDGFLEPDFALEVARSYPSYAEAERLGRTFKAVNEYRKIQITDYDRFPEPVRRLADALGAPKFLEDLSHFTGIPKLLWDDTFAGGGMHLTGPHGLLDVHVDFNLLASAGVYRRLNLLLYLNPDWREEWGGVLELWDRDVKQRCHAIPPILNRCVIFETSDHSFHGVTALKCPEDVTRNSFAVYCYSDRAPPGWEGRSHSTIFRARPHERLKRHLLMPAEQLKHRLGDGVRATKRMIKELIGRK